MSWIDYALLALIVGYCLYLLLRKKKKGSCCGDCSQCRGCKKRDP
ncbi:MAG: FeoB-associated Cys-rich membrane protein [Firmicutes bacterium]|nr:FeoB-associated Cys-rich membrane protein [Bacillota bacterium]